MALRKPALIAAIAAGILALLFGGALLLVKLIVTPEGIRKNVLPRIEKALHRRVEFGDARIGLFSGIQLEKLKIFERDNSRLFVSADEVRLHYRILPLLRRRLVVDEIVLQAPVVLIVRNSDGSFNFSDLERGKSPETPAGAEKTGFTFAVSGISVNNGTLIYEDRKATSGAPFRYRAWDIGMSIRDFVPGRPFPLKASGRIPGAEVRFKGLFSPLKDSAAIEGEVTADSPDVAKVVAGLSSSSQKLRSLSISGKISSELKLSGDVKKGIAIVRGGEIGIDRVSIVAAGQRPEISGKLHVDQGTLVSRNLVVQAGRNRINVALKTTPLNRSPIGAVVDLRTDALDLDALFPPGKPPGSAHRSSSRSEGAEPGPFRFPLLVSGTAAVKTASFRGLVITGISLRYRLAGQMLNIEDLRGSAAGGSFIDRTAIDLGTRGLSYTASFELQGMRAEKLAAAFAPKAAGNISGTLFAKGEIRGSGTAPTRLRRNLTGSGSFDVRNGKLTGKGFPNELARFLGSDELRIVRFASFTGTCRLKSGQILIDSKVDGSDIRMKPNGRIGLDKTIEMSIDTRISPRITSTVARGTVGRFITDEQGWGVLPLRATGTIESPRFSVSARGVGRRIGEKLEETLRGKIEKQPGAQQDKRDFLDKTIRGIFGR